MRVSSTLDELKKQYGDNLRIVWKHYVVHPQVATDASLAACAAQQQGKFKEFHEEIWAKGWEGGRMKDISAPAMEKIAQDLKLDMNKFKADMASQKCKDDLANDQKMLAAVGTRGTPAFYINGRYLSGAQPIDSFKKLIDEEMKKADDAIKAGAKAEEYYSSIVAKGKKSVQ